MMISLLNPMGDTSITSIVLVIRELPTLISVIGNRYEFLNRTWIGLVVSQGILSRFSMAWITGSNQTCSSMADLASNIGSGEASRISNHS
jgi:hypothetical protein